MWGHLVLSKEVEEILNQAANCVNSTDSGDVVVKHCLNLEELTNEYESIKLKGKTQEVDICQLKLTEDNEKSTSLLETLTEQNIKFGENNKTSNPSEKVLLEKKISKYEELLSSLKNKLSTSLNGADPDTFESECCNLFEKLQETIKKCETLETKLSKYQSFPANILEGKQLLANTIKEYEVLRDNLKAKIQGGITRMK